MWIRYLIVICSTPRQLPRWRFVVAYFFSLGNHIQTEPPLFFACFPSWISLGPLLWCKNTFFRQNSQKDGITWLVHRHCLATIKEPLEVWRDSRLSAPLAGRGPVAPPLHAAHRGTSPPSAATQAWMVTTDEVGGVGGLCGGLTLLAKSREGGNQSVIVHS